MEDEQLTDPGPIKIAYIIDGEVVDILHTDERLASIFLSNPILVDVTDKFNNGSSSINIGTRYDSTTGIFSNIVE
jgi:hypothetical protein